MNLINIPLNTCVRCGRREIAWSGNGYMVGAATYCCAGCGQLAECHCPVTRQPEKMAIQDRRHLHQGRVQPERRWAVLSGFVRG